MIKKITTQLLLVLLVCANCVYAKNIYVTKMGNDANAGTQAAPYLTISKAAAVAVAGDVVLIGGGTYEETLKPANSGTSGNPIVFQSVAGEKVVISAMQVVSGFTKDVGSIYKTTLTWDLGQRNFVLNGATVLDLARWPNNTDGDRFTLNSLRNDGGSQDEVSTNAFLTDADIPNWNWKNGGSVMFYGDRPGSGWTTWKAWIKGNSAGRVDFDAIKNQTWIISSHPPGDLGDYYLEGIKEALDYQNEWYFDVATKTLYLQLPNGVAPVDGQVSVARREKTIDLTGKSYIEIRNVAVLGGGIDINATGNKIVGVSSFYGSMTRGITPNFNSGVNAVNIDWNAKNTTIEKCEIAFGDGSGIWDSGSGTTIKNCYVHDFDMLGSYDAPLMVRGQNNAKILNNKVTRGGRDALQIISKGSEVAYNDFSYSNLIADDCALLYTIGANLNMDIHHNWFHDAYGRGKLYKAAGIYMDNDAGNVRVYRNVVWNVEWTNVQINWNGTDIDIFNNTLVKATSGTMGAWHMAGTQFTNVKVWNNITDKQSTGSVGGQEQETTWEPQSDKQNNLVDKTSFVDFANNNFQLKATTPAVDFGRVISGYTDGFKGTSPDVGAYELGDNWIPGVDWDIAKGPNNVCYGLPGEGCSVVNPTVESVAFVNQATTLINPTAITVNADYTVAQARDIVAVISKPDGTWLAEARKTVQAGTGSNTFTINLIQPLPAANGYQLKLIIRTVGGDWTANVKAVQQLIDIKAAGTCSTSGVYNECFESGTYTWGGWGAAERVLQSTQVYSGNYALKVKGIGASNFTVTGLTPNTTYDFTAYAKVVGTQPVNVGVKEFNAANDDKAVLSTNTNFEMKTISFTTGTTQTSAQIYMYSPNAAGEGYLDDITIVKALVTGVGETKSTKLSAYPNPTSSAILLSERANWELMTLQGEVLEHGEGQQIELEEYTPGVYLLKAEATIIRIIKN